MKCPGQDMQFWNSSAIYEVACPRCGRPVEFYKDDTARRCGECGHRFPNPTLDFGCAAYCPHARQCIGELPESGEPIRENLLKDRVAIEVKRRLGRDFGTIARISRLANHLEKIGRAAGADLAILLCAGYLTGVPPESGANSAQAVLAAAGAEPGLIEAVTATLAPNSAGGETPAPLESLLLEDGLQLVELEEFHRRQPFTRKQRERRLETELKTPAAREYGRLLLEPPATG